MTKPNSLWTVVTQWAGAMEILMRLVKMTNEI